MGGAFLANGTEAKIVTGIDDHCRYCVSCRVVPRATGRAVCLAFAAALRAYGIPGEVLGDSMIRSSCSRMAAHVARCRDSC